MIIDFAYDMSGNLTTLSHDGLIIREGQPVDTTQLPDPITEVAINGNRLVVLACGVLYEAVPRRPGSFNGIQHWTEIGR